LLTLFIANTKLFAEESSNIQLSYKILESSSTDEDMTILANLKAKNKSLEPLYDVTAIVVSVNNMTIDINQIYLGDINPGGTIESIENFTISFKNSSSQEPPQIEIVWLVKYNDENKNPVVEEILLK
jgi:hypothetical protein